MVRVSGKVALITGAAAGIGEATARLLAKEGAKVVITTSRKEVEGRALADSINGGGGEATFIKLDVTEEGEWQEVMDEVVNKYGELHILVNNAGVPSVKNIEELSLDEWNQVMNVNAAGVFLGTKYAIKTMKTNGKPCSIINISSIEAMVGEPHSPAYNASKGAVRAFSNTTALHCAKEGHNIRVNSVYPGYIHTSLIEQEAKDAGLTTEQYFNNAIKMTPLGHLGEPIDIAYIVLFLASDESKYVTGAEFVVDGGWTAK